MKINWKEKKTRVIAAILAVIILPILFNQCSSLFTGLLMAYKMSLPKTVQVAHPEMRDIYPEFETTGRVEAKYSVDIIARVSGWLQKRFFEEGDFVKKGQRLFVIEPDEYVLAAKNARASVSENSAVYKNSQIELNRAKQLLKEDLVSREYYDNALTKRNSCRATLDGATAQYYKARLDLSYTNITSPMNGRIGKVKITEGNFVTASSGTIATIYSTTPMKVIFSLRSAEFIALKKYHKESKGKKDLPVIVKLKLADGSLYDCEGSIEFIDNEIDKDTGSVSMRAIFDNPDEILVPGDFVNVILQVKKKHKVMLIPQSATKTNVGSGYYVWVVKNGKAERRDIEVEGNIDNNWVVTKGLNEDDVVIVKGIQDIYKTGQKVKTEQYKPEPDKKQGK